MAIEVGTLLISMQADLARLSADMGKATKTVDDAMGRIKRSADIATKALGLIGVGVSVGALSNLVKRTADFADGMGKAAQKAGTTVEALSGLAYAGELADVGLEQIQTGLGQLSQKLEAAKGGSKEAAELFAKLKLDPKNFKDSAEALAAIADRFAAMPDGIAKTALAKDIGKAWVELIPLLNSGSIGIRQATAEAERFGLIVTGSAAKAAEEFNDNVTRLQSMLKGFGVSIAQDAIGPLNALVGAFIDVRIEQNKLDKSKVTDFAESIAIGFARLADVLTVIPTLIKAVSGSFNVVYQDILTLNAGLKLTRPETIAAELLAGRSPLEEFKKQLAERNRVLLDANETYFRLWNDPANKYEQAFLNRLKGGQSGSSPQGGASGGEPFTPGTPTDPDAKQRELDKLTEAQQNYMSSVAALGDKVFELNAVERSKVDILQDELDAMVRMPPAIREVMQAQIDQARASATSAEELERLTALMASVQESDDAQSARDKDFSENYDDTLRQIEDLNIQLIASDKERARKQLEVEHDRLIAMIAMNADASEEQKEIWIEAENERYEVAKKVLEKDLAKTKDYMKELGATFTSAFEDAIAGGKKFGDVLAGLAQDIERMLTRRFITDPLMKGLEGAVLDPLSQWFGGLFANADGGVYAGAGIGAYSGTIVDRPTVFPFARGIGLMGEAGPEAILPLKRGSDGKLGISGSGGANVTVNLIEAPGNGGQVNQTQQADGSLTIDVMVEQIEGKMGRNIAKGTGLAPMLEKRYGLNRTGGSY
jgi:anion-transporting  ArsA/GET3 family ATPase